MSVKNRTYRRTWKSQVTRDRNQQKVKKGRRHPKNDRHQRKKRHQRKRLLHQNFNLTSMGTVSSDLPSTFLLPPQYLNAKPQPGFSFEKLTIEFTCEDLLYFFFEKKGKRQK